MKAMRQSTLETIGLGSVLGIFQNGKRPVTTDGLVDKVFGPSGKRGSMVVSGANGIVGAGKMMQLGSRLMPYGVTMVGLDFPSAPDGIGRQYQGLRAAFGQAEADKIMTGMVRLNYDGRALPDRLRAFNPRFLLEAIPEILEIKRSHYEVFRSTFPEIAIRSVTSGFPSSELGVGIAHPAFPHEINKIWEVVESEPSDITKLFWSLGLIPMPVSDHWSFVLDVLFCGITLAALRYRHASNMPYWKVDKFVRKTLGPNPFRAHDAIGAKGATFLTWSCLHHLEQKYGALFSPTDELNYRKESGQNWYPLNHLRPLVNWSLSDDEEETYTSWLMGPMIQMTSLLLHEKRGHLTHLNAIGELCAQFRSGVLAMVRRMGADHAIKTVESYHRLHPEAGKSCWYPETFEAIDSPEWQQLYVNAEHDGTVGVISLARESYNGDVDTELNRAIDWLKSEKIERLILTGDFHLTTQLVGADTADFYPALEDSLKGVAISSQWSATARRLHTEFKRSVGYVGGKRCLGGMLELMMHCHYLVAVDGSSLGMPEVTLPVIPGMEGCHWSIRKAGEKGQAKVLNMLLTGRALPAGDTVGFLTDFAGDEESCLKTVWQIATDGDHKLPMREVMTAPVTIKSDISLPKGSPTLEESRRAIMACVTDSCGVGLDEALAVQAKHSGDFMCGKLCNRGVIGATAQKVMNV